MVTDSVGCSATTSVYIPSPDTAVVLPFLEHEKCDKGNGQIGLSVQGNNGPFSYFWSQGLGSSSFVANLSSGNYTVTITDKNNCTSIKTYTVNNIPALWCNDNN